MIFRSSAFDEKIPHSLLFTVESMMDYSEPRASVRTGPAPFLLSELHVMNGSVAE